MLPAAAAFATALLFLPDSKNGATLFTARCFLGMCLDCLGDGDTPFPPNLGAFVGDAVLGDTLEDSLGAFVGDRRPNG